MTRYYSIEKPLGANKHWEAKLLLFCKQLRINVAKRGAKKKGKVVTIYDISCKEEEYKTLLKMMEDNHESQEN